jgi:hypothetical protein
MMGSQNARNVAVEGSRVLAMLDKVVIVHARLHYIGRQVVHVDVALVEGDDAGRGVIQHKALRHIVERGVDLVLLCLELLLRLQVLPIDQPDDQEKDDGDHDRRQRGGGDQEACLRLPVGQCRGDGVGCDDDDRRALQRRSGAEPVQVVDRALDAHVCRPPFSSTRCTIGAVLNFRPIIVSICG